MKIEILTDRQTNHTTDATDGHMMGYIGKCHFPKKSVLKFYLLK